MRRSPTGLAALGLFTITATALGAEPMVGGTRYRLTIDNELKISRPGAAPEDHWGSVAYDFRVARKDARVEMAIDRSTNTTKTKYGINRTETTRSGMVRQALGEVTTTARANATPQQAAAFDQMEAPLVVLTLDAEGGEIGRELRAENAYAGFVDLLRTFSPRIPKDKVEWDARTNLLPLSGQATEGTLHYVKRPAAKPGGPIEVDVSGKLKLTGKWFDGDIKAGQAEARGVQTYDPSLGEWVAGKLTMAREAETVAAGGETKTIRMTTVMTLTREETPAGAAEKAKRSP